ncbi:tetratricopeptide repeat protein [Rhizobium sp. P32RR-XVIII]|uniref:tetratricopeptide repeat protein n=1 Tax=Rhizobium sp. P32RR-XVIII TaxID=2726738 RepID=UPI001456C6A6|nr:tetratricopeptide repeat protein [Rhizobium sp. P32RR-XVIII]NLS03548.1 tetratricopeptide repeat protein [Rhizobium sp. P32RR-XVIII]
MSAEVHDVGTREVSLEEAGAELERLLADGRFRVSDRQREILLYLAERRLAGYQKGVKAYSIALDVLGRTSAFDAANDPIVRIEISRLRTALDNYYAVFAEELGVSIHIPKGSYVTLFPKTSIRHEPDDQHLDDDVAAVFEAAPAYPSEIRSPVQWRRLAALGGIGLVVCLAAAALYFRPITPTATAKPTLLVAMTAASADMEGEASLTRDMLLSALTQFQTVIVARPGSVAGGAGRSDPSYDIEMKYYGDGDDRSVWWQVVDGVSGNLLRSGLERVELSGKSAAAVREEMAGALATRVASSRGVINTIEMQDAPRDALGNGCVLRAEYALEAGDADDVSEASRCLERTLARSPDDPDASALLSRVLVAPRGRQVSPEIEARALDFAKRAASLAPLSDRAQTALMAAQFAAGRTEAAIQAGNRAIALNPNNPEAAAALGFVLFSSGYWEAGVDLARDASRDRDTVPRDAMLVLALDAYRNSRWSEASLLAEQVNGTDFLVCALRVAALGQLGAEDAEEKLPQPKALDREFEQAFRQQMATARMRPEIVAGIEAGLAKAGADFDGVASIRP